MRPPGLERRIRAELEGRIRSGEWPPGHRLPTEQALVAEYGCARMTVGKAIAALVAAGLVVRNKRAGSFVAYPHFQSAVLEIPDLRAVVEGRGETYRYAGRAARVRLADPEDPDEQWIAPNAEVLALEGLHFAHDRPFALERRIISLAAVPQARELDFSVTAPGAWLLEVTPWSEAEHRIAAVNPTAVQARALGIPRAEACLRVKRWTWRAGVGVTFVAQLFPGAAYDLAGHFRANAAEPVPRR